MPLLLKAKRVNADIPAPGSNESRQGRIIGVDYPYTYPPRIKIFPTRGHNPELRRVCGVKSRARMASTGLKALPIS